MSSQYGGRQQSKWLDYEKKYIYSEMNSVQEKASIIGVRGR